MGYDKQLREQVRGLVITLGERLNAMEDEELYEQCANLRDTIRKFSDYYLGYCDIDAISNELQMWVESFGTCIGVEEQFGTYYASWFTTEPDATWMFEVNKWRYTELEDLMAARNKISRR